MAGRRRRRSSSTDLEAGGPSGETSSPKRPREGEIVILCVYVKISSYAVHM